MNDFLNKNGGIVTLAKASVVPIGLYAFSKYNKYDSKKTMKVTIIGSVVILGALVINELSGFGSRTNKFSNRLFGFYQTKNIKDQVVAPMPIELPPLPIQNTPNNNKPCKKFAQVTCITAPCYPMCIEY